MTDVVTPIGRPAPLTLEVEERFDPERLDGMGELGQTTAWFVVRAGEIEVLAEEVLYTSYSGITPIERAADWLRERLTAADGLLERMQD